ncbi:hypothetical protein AB1K62_14560 [Parasphingorhabdus sp. JC815]|uniref:hypothetical protein n=1 Tax=Parasphingorhabdus sp. JC815 TaxID=3232140 RepID=UPI00345907F2
MAITNVQTLPKEADHGGIGHNKPPVEIEAKAAFDELVDADPKLRTRINQFIVPVKSDDGQEIPFINRVKVTSEESLGMAASTVKQIRTCMTMINAAHKEAKQPYLDGGRIVDAEKNALFAPLSDLKAAIEGKQSAYVRDRENARRKREAEEQAKAAKIERERQEAAAKAEADRLAAIEAGKPAPEPEPEPEPTPAYVAPVEKKKEPVRGYDGTVASTTMVKVPTVTDYAAAFAMVQSNAKVKEAIDKAVASLVKAGITEIPGVTITEEAKVVNR